MVTGMTPHEDLVKMMVDEGGRESRGMGTTGLGSERCSRGKQQIGGSGSCLSSTFDFADPCFYCVQRTWRLGWACMNAFRKSMFSLFITDSIS